MKIKYITLSAFIMMSMAAANESKATSVSNPPIVIQNTDKSPYNYSREEVKAEIKTIIAEICGIQEGGIPDDELLLEDLGLDSFDMLQLILECEGFFGISFNEADALYYSSLYTVDSFTDVIYHFCQSDGDYKG